MSVYICIIFIQFLFIFLIITPEAFYGFFIKIKTFFIYDFLSGLHPYLCKKLLIKRLAGSEDVFFELCGGIFGVVGIIANEHANLSYARIHKDFMKIGKIPAHIFACTQATPVEQIDKLLCKFIEEVTEGERRVEFQERILEHELGYCRRKLLIKLNPFWEHVVIESLMNSSSVCQKVKERVCDKRKNTACNGYTSGNDYGSWIIHSFGL